MSARTTGCSARNSCGASSGTGGSLLGWAIILTSTSTLPTTAWTVLGLPAVTALGLSLVMVASRAVTGLDLEVQTDGGQLLVAITGAIVGGFVVRGPDADRSHLRLPSNLLT